MKKLTILVGLVVALALALPGGADAAVPAELKLSASDAQLGDGFGMSVAVSGDTAIVGAPQEDTGGDQAGAAYVFQRDEGGASNWGEVKKLTHSGAFGYFGTSVAVSGDTAVVGRPSKTGFGAAYVFQRDEGGADNWGEVTILLASDPDTFDFFGMSVAVSGDTAVLGASGEDAGGSSAGAAYVFQRDEGGADNWGEVRKLTASDAQADDNFGIVAVSGDTAVVGAYLEDAGGSSAGAAYVFQRDEGGAGNWGEVRKLTASDAQADDRFGESVAVSGDTAVVGAFFEDAGGSRAGAAYAFQRDQGGAGNWGEVTKLTASDAQANDLFGSSAAISGDTTVVGAHSKLVGGSAYVFDGPLPVGGIAELPEAAATPLETDGSSGTKTGLIAGVAGAVAAAALALGGAAWYATRRRRHS